MVHDDDFRAKYTESGRVGQVLVNRFYFAVEELLQQCLPDVAAILEVGIGEGFSTQRIGAMLPSAVHFEASEFRADLVQLAKQRNPGVHVRQESIYTLNRDSSAFDLVISLEVLEHLEDPLAALRELARVSRKYVLVSVPREPIWRLLNMMRGKYLGEFGNTPGHLQHWSARGFRKFVNPAFWVLDMRTPLPWTVLLLQKKA